MEFIDTHTHLYLEDFSSDIDEIIERAIASGVNKLFLPAVDSSTTRDLVSLCKKYPQNCFPMVGLHPTSVKADFQDELRNVEDELKKGFYIAVGEIGIDLYWDKTYFKEQSEAFLRQLSLAKQYHLPVVIHTRDSFNETYDLINSFTNESVKGIFHCFSGNVDDAFKIIEKGFKIGVGGVVTFKNSLLSQVVKEIELEHIVLETDAPYLTPTPYRGKRNESSYIPIIARKIAEIKDVSLEEVATITTRNAYEVFGNL